MVKAATVIIEELDERGRYISTKEFRWIMAYFRDRYDPRRLSFALMYVTGLRHEDGVRARIRWFSPDFREMKMSQCKAHIRKKDGVVQARVKAKFVPIPEWLADDLKNYAKYRIAVGHYVGRNIEDGRLFPTLRKEHHRCLFQKLRIRHGDKEPWLRDLWKIERRFDANGNFIRNKKWYRVACHAPRANYVTAAYEVSGHDIAKTKVLSGHHETKDVERYIRVTGIQEKKLEIMNRYMEPLVSDQKIPVHRKQRKLSRYL